MNSFAILLTFSLLYFTISPVFAIKCYVCSTETDQDCLSYNPDVLRKFQVDCSFSWFTRCALSMNHQVAVRSCSMQLPHLPDTGCNGGATAYCSCSTDFCNGGSAAKTNINGRAQRFAMDGVEII